MTTTRQMNYAYDGERLGLISKSTKIFPQVPPGTYTFGFSQDTGIFIVSCDDVPTVTNKVYGDTTRRVEKAWRAFKRRERNTGVLLSGEAGMGKSMFIKLICAKAKEEGYPIFLVKDDVPGLTQMLSKITTECVIVLDEFEKNFRDTCEHEDNDVHSQDGFLSLMDGMDDGKKLFIAAVNETYNISRYMLNRPGRFLYHYTFGFCEQKDIVDYLEDSLDDKSKVDMLSTALLGHHVNYDALAAIVGEINAGEPLDETLDDLNLEKEDQMEYDMSIVIDGKRYTRNGVNLSMSNPAAGFTVSINDPRKDHTLFRGQIKFPMGALRKASNSKYETGMVVDASKVQCEGFQEWVLREGEDRYGDWKNFTPSSIGSLTFKRHYEYDPGYAYIGKAGLYGGADEAMSEVDFE